MWRRNTSWGFKRQTGRQAIKKMSVMVAKAAHDPDLDRNVLRAWAPGASTQSALSAHAGTALDQQEIDRPGKKAA